MRLKIIFTLIISQIFFLGVFALWNNEYYVINETENLCWVFSKGNASIPNWLPENWKMVTSDEWLHEQFLSTVSCELWDSVNCCKENSYRYAGVPIWVSEITGERRAAEFLASKKIINTHSLTPDEYKLWESITRKELMKIIMLLSGREIDTECSNIFTDVRDDWWCKYIETALGLWYIEWNRGFRPDDRVTQVEAIKLIFKAQDIKKAYQTEYWQEDYISSAYYYWYLDEKFSDYNTYATRGWIFLLAGRSMESFKNY